jgi:hypothetical protein
MASTGAVRKHLIENTSNFDPRKFLKEATNAMSDICAARFEAFGSAGNADKIKVSLQGPEGIFVLKEDSTRPLLFIAWDSGFASRHLLNIILSQLKIIVI